MVGRSPNPSSRSLVLQAEPDPDRGVDRFRAAAENFGAQPHRLVADVAHFDPDLAAGRVVGIQDRRVGQGDGISQPRGVLPDTARKKTNPAARAIAGRLRFIGPTSRVNWIPDLPLGTPWEEPRN